MPTRFRLSAAVLLAVSSPVAADALVAAHSYTVVDLGELHSPRDSGVHSINNAGQIVGGNGHAFLWDNGRTKDLGTLTPEGPEDATESIGYSINNKGQIVGSSGSFGPVFMSGLQFARGIVYENGRLRQFTQRNTSFEPYAINDLGQIAGLDAYRGFFYAHGKLTNLGTLSHVPVGNRSTARALNNRGQVVGWSTAPGPNPTALPVHAFVWQKTGKINHMRDLGTLPGWANSYAYGINDQDEIIGSVSDSKTSTYGVYADSHAQACLWRKGKAQGLGTLPGCRNSEAFGINRAGTIVGQSDGKAFVWAAGKMRDLNELLPVGSLWVLKEARAINGKSQIVGTGMLAGQLHMFLLTPR